MRIAFFGGTFDPIHRGHLAIATAAADTFVLDRVLFAPVGTQPLKPEEPGACFADRLAMVELACAADPRFTPSTLDAPGTSGMPNYTVDALAALALQQPAATLFLLTGADSLLDLRRWRDSDRLLALAEWIAVSRPEFPLTEDALFPLALTPSQRTRIHLLATVHDDVSATELRHRLHAGDPCHGLIPLAVADYIRSHHLYG